MEPKKREGKATPDEHIANGRQSSDHASDDSKKSKKSMSLMPSLKPTFVFLSEVPLHSCSLVRRAERYISDSLATYGQPAST